MIKNKYRFELLARSLETSQFCFNMVLFSIPVFVIFWVPGLWVCIFVILFLYHSHANENSYLDEAKKYYSVNYFRFIAYSYIAYFVFSLISILFFSSPLQSIDNACIFLIWLAISPVMAILKPSSYILGYGCLAAVVMAFLMAAAQFHVLKIDRPYGMYGAVFPGTGAIKFGDISLLIGIMAYILLSGNKLQLLGVLGALFGLTVCLYAGARGGIFAALLCSVVWVFFIRTNRITIIKVCIVILFIGLAIFILNTLTDNHILSRIKVTMIELANINNNNFNTSIGTRFQMWRAALMIFENNPILGVGLNNFDNALLVLYKQHVVPKSIIKYSHAHNEYLCALATGGIVGFVITLFLFFLPMSFFKTDYHEIVWGKLGFWGVCLIAFFALTDCIFDRRMTVMTFAVLISICISGSMAQNNTNIKSRQAIS